MVRLYRRLSIQLASVISLPCCSAFSVSSSFRPAERSGFERSGFCCAKNAMRTAALAALLSGATAKISQNRLYSDDMILESREAYDIRPFIVRPAISALLLSP